MTRGGKRPGAGRPREAQAARATKQIRCTLEQLAGWQEAAKLEGRELSEVARELLDRWAERVLTK